MSKYACHHDKCLAAVEGVDDLPVAAVLKIASHGWRWDGKRMTCPAHAEKAAAK